jgi:hypothetical protein
MYFNSLVSGPNATPPYVQPGAGNPASNSGVASYAVGSNPLALTQPLPPYWQPDFQPAIRPQGIIPGQFGAGTPNAG